MESNFQSKFLQKTSRINKWLKGQAYDCLRETEKERHIPSQLAGRAYSACTASLPNLTLFVIPSSPIYIIFNSDCKNWSCTSCSKKILPEDVSNCRISKGIAAVDKKKETKEKSNPSWQPRLLLYRDILLLQHIYDHMCWAMFPLDQTQCKKIHPDAIEIWFDWDFSCQGSFCIAQHTQNIAATMIAKSRKVYLWEFWIFGF